MLPSLAIYSPFVSSPNVLLPMAAMLGVAAWVVARRFTSRIAWAYLLLAIGLASDVLGTYYAVSNAESQAAFVFGIDLAIWFSIPVFALLVYVGFAFRSDPMPVWQRWFARCMFAVAGIGLVAFAIDHGIFYYLDAGSPFGFEWNWPGHVYFGYLLQPGFAIAALALAARARSAPSENEARFAAMAFAGVVAWEILTLSTRILRYGTGATTTAKFDDPFLAWHVVFEWAFFAAAIVGWYWIRTAPRAPPGKGLLSEWAPARIATLGLFGAGLYGLLVPGGAAALGAPVGVITLLLWVPMVVAFAYLGKTIVEADYGESLTGVPRGRYEIVVRETRGAA